MKKIFNRFLSVFMLTFTACVLIGAAKFDTDRGKVVKIPADDPVGEDYYFSSTPMPIAGISVKLAEIQAQEMSDLKTHTKTVSKASDVDTVGSPRINDPSSVEEQPEETPAADTQETEVNESEPVPQPEQKYFTERDVVVIAKIMTKEAGGIASDTQKSAVAWCILNRLDYDGDKYDFGDSIVEVATKDAQFAWDPNTHYHDDCYALARDVLERWNQEKNGHTDVGRTLPKEYMFFYGDGAVNHFRDEYLASMAKTYHWTLSSPYST